MEKVAALPVKREVGNVFIPVKDIHRAREWYRDVLELPVGAVEVGHLCCIRRKEVRGMAQKTQSAADLSKRQAGSIGVGLPNR